MAVRARPTIRCLMEELASSVEDPNQRSALASRRLKDLGPAPLDQIVHPLLVKATEQFVGRPLRELHGLKISSVTDHSWYRAKVGQWRGAVSIDADGQVWLCAAGLRRDGDTADFYTSFEQACETGSGPLLPTETDGRRLRLERVAAAEEVRRRLLAARAIAAFLTAAESGTAQETRLPTSLDPVSLHPIEGAILVVEPVEGGGGVDELTLSVRVVDYQAASYHDTLEEVQQAFPGLAEDDWDVIPAHGIHTEQCWYALVDDRWVGRLRKAISTSGLDAFVEDPPDLTDGADGLTHVVPRHHLEAALIDGRAVHAVCGRRFVQKHDPATKPMCEECAPYRSSLRKDHQRVDYRGLLSFGLAGRGHPRCLRPGPTVRSPTVRLPRPSPR